MCRLTGAAFAHFTHIAKSAQGKHQIRDAKHARTYDRRGWGVCELLALLTGSRPPAGK